MQVETQVVEKPATNKRRLFLITKPNNPEFKSVRVKTRRWLFALALLMMMTVFSLSFGRLALLRYYNHEAGAMDIGYISQVFYNTAHGEPFRLTVYDPSTGPDRYNNYFFYHAEPIIFGLAPLYGLFNRPEALLLFQAITLALGAIPAYWLGRDRLGNSGWAGLTFAALYLLAPSLQAATLSDYHNVVLAAPLFMAAFYFGWRRKGWLFALFALLAAATKEDVTLLAAAFGLYAFFVWRLRWAGGLVAVAAVGWFLVVSRLVMPYFGSSSEAAMLYRFRAYGSNPLQIVSTILFNPVYVWETLPRGEILAYLTGLWQQSGGLALLNPLALLVGLPVMAINIFSDNYWQHSGGAHYSAALIPFLIGSSVTGLGWLTERKWLTRRLPAFSPRQLRGFGLMLALALASFYYLRTSVGPFAFNSYAPQPSVAQARHQRLLDNFLAEIPAGSSVSAQSSLVAFVSQRRTVFLYPRLLNNQEFARFVLLDVTGNPFPQKPPIFQQGVKDLLDSGDYRLVDAEDGYLLLERLLSPSDRLIQPLNSLPAKFYSFLEVDASGGLNLNSLRHDRGLKPNVDNGVIGHGELSLLGTEVVVLGEIGSPNPPLEITTYWEVLRPPTSDWQIGYEFTNQRNQAEEPGRTATELFQRTTAATFWRPTSSWKVSQIIRVRDYPVFAGKYQNVRVILNE